jgi:hypothetical protein
VANTEIFVGIESKARAPTKKERKRAENIKEK